MIDARGMRCPWPAIRLARALRGSDDAVAVLADDPAAERELRAVAEAAGRVIVVALQGDVPVFRIEAVGAINPSFTDSA